MKGNISIYMCYKENSVFLKEENRDGYIVSALMKKVWAVELDLLSELDRVCKSIILNIMLPLVRCWEL